jgi:hypothetical protein
MENTKDIVIHGKQTLSASEFNISKDTLTIEIVNCVSTEWKAVLKKIDKAKNLKSLKIKDCAPHSSIVIRYLEPNPNIRHLSLGNKFVTSAGNNILSSDIQLLFRLMFL